MSDPGEGLTQLLAIFDRMEAPYLVGGSVASAAHGIPRTTMDVDLIADLDLDELAQQVDGFYCDRSRGDSLELIHLATGYKYDIFPLGGDPYSRTSFARRGFTAIHSFGEPVECAVATPEDTVLTKLMWFRAGGETSKRQWNDLRGIRMISGATLDYDYLRKWAQHLKVDDLLERLLAE